MKKINKGIIIIGILACFININTAYALTKNETVYTKLNSDGSIKNTIVNEQLKNLNKGNVSDLTDLSNILNVNGNEKFTLEDNKLTFDSLGDDIYYQGVTDKELPVKTKVTYKLNDEEKDINDILGKSGKVTIQINYKNTSSKNVVINGKSETLYTPFVVTTASIISNKENSNITITNGKVVSNGQNSVLVSIATPGLSDSLNMSELDNLNNIVITFDTKKFKLPSIYSSFSSKLLDENDLDIFDKVDNMTNKVNTLSSSSKRLVEGASKLDEGVATLKNGSSKLKDGSNKLNNGLYSALDGIKKLETGSTEVDNNLGKIITGIKQSEDALNAKKNEFEAKKAELDTLKNSNTSAITKLNYANNTIKTTLNEYGIDVTLDRSTISGAIDGMGLPEENKTTILNLKDSYDGNNNLIYLLNVNNNTLDTLISTLDNSLTDINTNLSTLESYLSKLQTEGTTSIKNGLSELKNGLNTLYSGSNELYSGITSLDSGVDSLKNGTNELKEGMSKFDKEGINQITNLVNNKLVGTSKRFKELTKLGNSYDSFTMKNSSDGGETRFITIIDSMEKKETEKEATKQTKEKESLIDKSFK